MKYRPHYYSYNQRLNRNALQVYRRRLIRTASIMMSVVLASTLSLYGYTASANGNDTNDLQQQTSGTIVMSEFQTGGCAATSPADTCSEDSKHEFIELYNQTDMVVDLESWTVAYVSASGNTTTLLVNLSGTLNGHGRLLLSHAGYYGHAAAFQFGEIASSGKLAKSGGHIQLKDKAGTLQDIVGWGSAALALIKPATAPTPGKSLYRPFVIPAANDPVTMLQNTGNNNFDFIVSDTPTPESWDYTAAPPPIVITPDTPPAPAPDPGTLPDVDPENPPPAPDPLPTPGTVPPVTSCQGIIISEVVPNPAGSDGGNEYIELHNPTDETISLAGCSLQSSASSKTYTLNDMRLDPDQYKKFTDSESGLTLPNAAGGTVWLLSSADEIDSVDYPADMPDDTAWALVDGTWAQSYAMTPDGPNIWMASEPCPAGQERNLETNRCATAGQVESATNTASPASTSAGLVACKIGQERNPETNRCRNVTTASNELTPCKTGQVRNPETNRCSAVASSITAPVACKTGQERNPATNRCRNIVATAENKACPAGQERNPETNRCKKSAAASVSATTVEDVKTPTDGNSVEWLLPFVAIVGALAYAIYEWRVEIRRKIRSLLGKSNLGPGRTDARTYQPLAS